jgi:hypothetical protein
MSSAATLVHVLRERKVPAGCDWTALISAARAEKLTGSLAQRLDGIDVPAPLGPILEEARRESEHERTRALWEAEMCRRALAPLGVPVILLKGTAFHAAVLDAAAGRTVGDLDILVPRASLDVVEAALIRAGWERLKPSGGYDDEYYRRWMHELPPLIHAERDRMIDVHHTILPPTARPRPDAASLVEQSVLLESGLRVLSPADMVIHAAAHLMADGDLAGGLRNLWDIDRLVREFSSDLFWEELAARAGRHQLMPYLARALRLSSRLFATPVDLAIAGAPHAGDGLFQARLLARNGWGQPTRKLLRLAFYVRSHWMRMPPHLLFRHLLIKARKTGLQR